MNIIYYILFNLILAKLTLSYVIFPFKTRSSIIPNTDKDITALFKSLIDNNIFIELELGTPPQKIEVFLRSTTPDFYISEKNKSDERTSGSNPYIYDVGSDLNKFYDKSSSKSLQITSEEAISEPLEEIPGNVSNDIFHFINNNKEIKDKRFTFILFKSTLGYMPGVMGLHSILSIEDRNYNFLDQLKKNDVINSYFWMINYTSNYEGNLILGEQPHIFDPNNYKEEDLYFSHPFIYDDFYDWGLPFDEISFNNIKFRQFHDNSFSHELNYIKGGIELEQQLDIYFNEYINNKICFKESIENPYGPNKFYYCKKELYEKDLSKFPSLKLFQYDFNFTFELTYKELFLEKNDKLILMIFFDKRIFDWEFGKPFLRKYSFLMNQDTKLIGFYKKKFYYKNKEEKNWNSFAQSILFLLLVICVVILLIIFGIFLGMNFFRKKKCKYTIDDEYEYTTKNDDIIN